MGYYAEMTHNLRVKPELIDKVRQEIEEWCASEGEPDLDDFRHYFFPHIKVDDDGSVEFTTSYLKPYNDTDFAKWLASRVEDGFVKFIGDDETLWEYWFNGKGDYWLIAYDERW